MDIQEAILQLKECEEYDIEKAHHMADIVLCLLLESIGGYEEVLYEYNKIEKWYA